MAQIIKNFAIFNTIGIKNKMRALIIDIKNLINLLIRLILI